jgi:hypothetical protein
MTNQAITEIEQDQQKAKEDYTKEQSAAYVDYQKQSAQHGVNAEKMAAQGMTNTGYSESSKVAMYTAYQNRVAVARASFQQLSQDYDNAIANARLQNNVAIAELASKTLESRMQLALEGFKYKNTLLESKLAAATTVKNNYYSRYQDTLDRLQRGEEFEHQKSQDALDQQNWEKQYNLSVAQQQREEKLKSASLMASVGDFSGYKNLFGLTDAQVKKLEEAYKEETEPEDPPIQLSVLGNDNTKAAENAIMDEKGFNQYKTTIRTRVNGKNYTNYQDYVLAMIEDMANNGLNGRKFTDEEIEWLLAKYGDL